MLVRLVVVALVVALAAPAAASAAPTIKVGGDKYREVIYPGTFRIKGKTGTYRGPVTVEVDEFPFDGAFSDRGTVDTNDKGEYVFPAVNPTRNAQIRVRTAAERSKVTTVYVHPGVKRKETQLSRDRVRVTFTYLGHPGFAPPRDSFFVYISRSDRGTVQRLGGPFAMSQVADGTWRFKRVLEEPSSSRAYSYALLYCTRGLSASGYGRVWTIDRHCGEKSIKFPASGA